MQVKTKLLFSAMLMGLTAFTQPQQPPRPPGTEEKVKHVTEKIEKEISLTAAQKNQIAAAYKDFFSEMDKLRGKEGKLPPPPPPPPPADKAAVDRLSKARDAKIKASLSQTQYEKYVQLEKSLRPPPPPPNN
ncbi:MAG: hypothetical protein RLZZ28_671 [Bacteroidota bacterium]|jgi:membrane-associated HD superfamily phosphohydrolase